MIRKNDDYSALSCSICEVPMTIVFIEPRVASFNELQIFRCFACGDVRAIERKEANHVRALTTKPHTLPTLWDSKL
jgi:hypothetical protein